MDPERWKTWQAIFRDFAIVIIAAFMLIFGTTHIKDPTILTIVVGGGLGLLGAPAAIRADVIRRNQRDDKRDDGGDDERWSHLP